MTNQYIKKLNNAFEYYDDKINVFKEITRIGVKVRVKELAFNKTIVEWLFSGSNRLQVKETFYSASLFPGISPYKHVIYLCSRNNHKIWDDDYVHFGPHSRLWSIEISKNSATIYQYANFRNNRTISRLNNYVDYSLLERFYCADKTQQKYIEIEKEIEKTQKINV